MTEQSMAYEYVDRRSFVMGETIRYSEARGYIDAPIVYPLAEYILDNMLVPDDQWEAGFRGNPDWFDFVTVRHTFVLSLQDIDRVKSLVQLTLDDLPNLVMKAFERRVHRWGCASPWIIC